jgi:hypothetical protein
MLSTQDFAPQEQQILTTHTHGAFRKFSPLVAAWNEMLEAATWERRARDIARTPALASAAREALVRANVHDQQATSLLKEYRSPKGGNEMSATLTDAKPIGNTQPAAPQTSAALEEVRAMRQQINTLLAKVDNLAALVERHNASVPPAQAAAVAQPDAHGNGYVVFMAETIVMTYNDTGEARYKVKGGRYAKFGVNLWPEALAALGVKAADLKPGPNAFGKMVRAELGETTNTETGEKSMVARKVVGLAE